MNRIFVRGDCHGDFDWLHNFTEEYNTTTNDLMILAGDSGLLFYGQKHLRENLIKSVCANAPLTFLVVRGNHDNRPANEGMTLRWRQEIEGMAYWEDARPNIIYAAEPYGSYCINSKYFLTIGGAYSVDKSYRLYNGLTWYSDEELTDDEMKKVLDFARLKPFHYIITHTCPDNKIPIDMFLRGIDQSTVSRRMEEFLQRIDNCVPHQMWIFGHYHGERNYGRIDNDEKPSFDDPGYLMTYNEITLLEDKNGESYIAEQPFDLD